jgi:hypothetical protein
MMRLYSNVSLCIDVIDEDLSLGAIHWIHTSAVMEQDFCKKLDSGSLGDISQS